jgi:hypothetical protein
MSLLPFAGPHARSVAQPEWARSRRWLIIDPARPLTSIAPFVETDELLYSRFDTLDAALLARVAPDLVLAPLIAAQFDILDLVPALDRMGYRGPVVIQTRPLPRADLVLGEIRALFPAQRLCLMETAA